MKSLLACVWEVRIAYGMAHFSQKPNGIGLNWPQLLIRDIQSYKLVHNIEHGELTLSCRRPH
jgi:hypothetical protein